MTQQKTAYAISDKFPRLERRLRLGIVGGGGGGFIGSVHALAARMDNRYELVENWNILSTGGNSR